MPSSTPIFGFPYPLGTDPVAQGDNVIQQLAEDVEKVLDAQVGLWLIKTETVTTPSAEILLSNVFSSAYTNYRVVGSNLDLSTMTSIRLQFRDAGGNITTGHIFGGFFVNMVTAPPTGQIGSGATSSLQISFSNTVTNTGFSAEIYRPFISGTTALSAIGADSGTMSVVAAQQTETKIVTGFRLFGLSGNISGTVSVYGYRD